MADEKDMFDELKQAFNQIQELSKQIGNLPKVQIAVNNLSESLKQVIASFSKLRGDFTKLSDDVGKQDYDSLIQEKITALQKEIDAAKGTQGESDIGTISSILNQLVDFTNSIKPMVHYPNTDTALSPQEKDLDMGGHNIVNVEGSEVATKKYVDEKGKLVKSGTGGRSRVAAMDDVKIASPTDDQSLAYDSATGKWINQTLASGGTVDTSGTPVANDIARFTDADTIEGRSYSEVKADLSLEDADITALAQAVKLDDFAAPDDNTDLDFSTSAHGLVPKGTNVGAFLKDDGTWAAPAGGGDVTGPASSTDNEIARQHSTTGKVLQTYTSNPPTISDTGDVNIDGDLDVENIVVSGNVDGVDVSAHDVATTGVHGVGAGTIAKTTDPPAAHKDSHDPNDGSDALDTANAAEISVVVAAGTGTAHEVARADHVHAINHGIADNHLLTVDQADAADDEFARFTANGIESLSVAEAITALLAAALPENVGIILDAVLSADEKWSGITEAGTAGAALAVGDLVYLASSGKWLLAKADAAATSFGKLGMVVLAAGADTNPTNVLLYGKIRSATLPALTVGAPVHISAATAGDAVVAAPTGTTNFVVRIIGYGATAEDLFFCPDNSYVELA